MSVLRKRSPWAIPAAGLLLGVLSLGLAGCGGSDNTQTPTIPVQIPSTIGTIPITLTATHPVTGQAGQHITLTGTVSDPNLFGGVTSISADIPNLGIDGTFGVELIPTSQGTIVRATQQGQTGFPPVVAEYVFGGVDPSTNLLDPNRPVVFNGNATTTIGLNAADLANLQQQLAAGCQLQVWTITVTPGSSTAQLTRSLNCTATLDATNSNITVTGSCTGDIVVFCVPLHLQGGVGG